MNRRQKHKLVEPVVRWLGGEMALDSVNPYTQNKNSYKGFIFGDIKAYVGDYVLVLNADADDSDTLDGCDIARIEHLFEATRKGDKHRAHVQWYTKPEKMPDSIDTGHLDDQYEVVEDYRNFDKNISVETIFKTCSLIFAYEDESPEELCSKMNSHSSPVFTCRYKLCQYKREYHLEPVKRLIIDPSHCDKPTGNDLTSNDMKHLSNSDITKKVTKNMENDHGHTLQTPNTARRKMSTPKSKPKTLDHKMKSLVLKKYDLNDVSVRLEPLTWKLSIESNSDSSRDASPKKIKKHSQKSTPRNGTQVKSNHAKARIFTNDSSDIENSPSNKMMNVRNDVVEPTPEKGQVGYINRKRKTRRSTSEESLEPRSRSNSPEIIYCGPPSAFQLYEKSGQSLIIKKPIDIEVKVTKKLNDTDISGLLCSDSESDSDTIFETVRMSGVKIVGKSRIDRTEQQLFGTAKNKEETPNNNRVSKKTRTCTPNNARRNLSSTLDVQDNCDTPKVMLLKQVAQRRDATPLRLKLRRSTEQSNYKIDSDSDHDNTKRKVVRGTPKSILKTSSRGPGTPNVRFTLSGKEEEGDATSRHSDNESIERSSRTRTPNSKCSGISDEISSCPRTETPNRRPRRSINYDENNLCQKYETSVSVNSNSRSSRSHSNDNFTGDENGDEGRPLSIRMSLQRGSSKKKDYDEGDDDDESHIESVTSKTRGKHSISKVENDVSRAPSKGCGEDASSESESIDSNVETNYVKKNRTPQRNRKSSSTRDISTPSKRNAKIQDDNCPSTTSKRNVGTPNGRFKFSGKERESDATSRQSVDESVVRRSSRICTPNSKYSGISNEITSCPKIETPNRRSRRSINYNEDGLYSNRRSSHSVHIDNNADNKNGDKGGHSSVRMSPRRGSSKKKDYNERDVSRTPRKGYGEEASSKPECIDSNVETNDLRRNRTPQSNRKSTSAREISTPRKRNAKIQDDDCSPTTPKRSVGTPKSQTPSRAARNGLLTPSMRLRIATIAKPATPLQEARSRLHVSAVPKSLPCREEEFNNIYTFLESKLQDNNGGCMYISGVPGTGKTATVNEVIRCLKKSVSKGRVDNFEFIEINGMKLTEPRQAYVQILKQLTGRSATWEQAHQSLEKRFTKPAPKKVMTLLLVDELDVLCNKRQDVVYNLLDWPANASAQLVVITIANTMDLPERVLMGRVTSRLGLTRLTFQPYTHKQLQEIVTARLNDSDAFKSEAVQLVARKVAAVSGDARRALDICRRATEIAELNNAEIVSMQDVNQALTEMIASAKVQAIRHCSEMERTFLQAVCAEVARTGVEEVTFNSVYNQLVILCSFNGVKLPTVTEAISICGRLGASRLLICEHSRKDIHQKILLSVSSDDVHFSMQRIDV